jgi:hypothetical protein
MLKRTILVFISILVASAVLAQAYKWTDENGIVHYSDRPQEGAERIELPSDGRRAPPPPPVTSAAAGTADDAAEEPGPFRYESLIIGAPLAEETLWNIEGVLDVALNLQPALQSGHRIRVYFDGTPSYVNRMSFQLDQVYRGVHNIQAEIVDESGTMMIRSMPNRFYVQQNTIRTGPANAPNPRRR